MKGPDPKILDDIARVAGGAVNVMSGLHQQIRDEIKSRVEEAADRMDLVPREDFELLQARVDKMLEQQKSLEAQLDKLAKGKPSSKATTKAEKPIKKVKAKAKKASTKKAAKKATAKSKKASTKKIVRKTIAKTNKSIKKSAKKQSAKKKTTKKKRKS